MPIYAYKCESCGFSKDVLQKMSDVPLSVCPQCNAPSFKKQLTSAGFQLKGSGWYATDFRNGNNGAPAAKPEEASAAGSGSADAASRPNDAGAQSAAPAATPAPAAVPATSADSSSSGNSSKNTSGNAASKSS